MFFPVYRNSGEEKLGSRYVESVRMRLAASDEESSPAIPMLFILSPGADPLEDIETLYKPLVCFLCKNHSAGLPLKKEKLTLKVKWSM